MSQDQLHQFATVPELKRRAMEIALHGTDIEAASLILGLCRKLRSECRAQAPGIPDLSTHKGQTAEGALIYEYLPELAARIIARSGVQMLRVADEQNIPDLHHFSDVALRLAIGDTFRQSRFPAIASRLRVNTRDRAIATEIMAAGDAIEVITSRLASPLPASDPAAAQDYLEIDRRRALALSKLAQQEHSDRAELEPEPSPNF